MSKKKKRRKVTFVTICLWWIFEFSKALMDVVFKINPGFFRSLLDCVRPANTFLHQLLNFRKVKKVHLGPQDNHWYFKQSLFIVTYS
jgi:hypothetical protein